MKLIVGLGNPGKEYEGTRHNVGFMTIDRLANKLGLSFKLETKFEGELATGNIGSNKVILLKPSTYMNLSGNSIIKVFNYYKINIEDLIIVYDDLDIPTGKIRIRQSGSAGGHNGIKSIIQSFSSSEFNRVRIGIDKDPRYKVVDYVLGKFSTDELALMNQAFDKTNDLLMDFIKDDSFNAIMNKYNR